MSDLIYRIRPESSLSHAYTSTYKDKKQTADRKTGTYANTKVILGRSASSKYGAYKAPSKNKGQYKSKYYDPVARHERYLEEKAAGKVGSGKGRSGGSGRGKSGKAGKGRKGGGAGIANAINKLREESELNTAAQQEATKRKIADLKDQLLEQIELLNKGGELEEGHNTAEIRGTIQSLKEQIQTEGTNLSGWISQEKTALARRIAKLQGKKYDEGAEERKKQQQEAKDKKVKQRADAIYKRKTGN